jgi:hypothetical protein
MAHNSSRCNRVLANGMEMEWHCIFNLKLVKNSQKLQNATSIIIDGE